MTVCLYLQHQQGFAWHQRDGWHVKGFLYGPNNEYLQGDALLAYVAQAGEPQIWLPKSNGHFIIVKQTGDSLWAAVDKLRAFPLFFTETDGSFWLADDAIWLANKVGVKQLDPIAAETLRTINCVTGNGTLLQGLWQLQAGQWLQIANGKEHITTYYKHLHAYSYRFDGLSNYTQLLHQEADGVFSRLVSSLQGRTAVIPLSGGYDSRFIAAMLKQLNYPKVICYTYGRPDSPEVAVSKKVAAQLGFPWHFVEYTPALLDTFMGEAGDSYRAFGAQLNSIAHEQDWFAIGQLLNKGILSADSVIIPGYCGDFPAGSYLPKEPEWQNMVLNLQGLANFIYQRHFERWGQVGLKPQVLALLHQELNGYTVTNRDELVSVYEHWLTINRLSRFIVNAIRVYEYYGLEWRMPLWDDAWANTWYQIPNSYRKERKLYKQYLEKQLFEPLKINYNMNSMDSLFEGENVFTKLKRLAPKSIRQGFKKLLIPANQQDANRLQWLAKRIYGQIEDKTVVQEPSAMNHVHACWYLETLAKQYKTVKP